MNVAEILTDVIPFRNWITSKRRDPIVVDMAMNASLPWVPANVYGPERKSVDGWRAWFAGLPRQHPALIHTRRILATEWEKHGAQMKPGDSHRWKQDEDDVWCRNCGASYGTRDGRGWCPGRQP